MQPHMLFYSLQTRRFIAINKFRVHKFTVCIFKNQVNCDTLVSQQGNVEEKDSKSQLTNMQSILLTWCPSCCDGRTDGAPCREGCSPFRKRNGRETELVVLVRLFTVENRKEAVVLEVWLRWEEIKKEIRVKENCWMKRRTRELKVIRKLGLRYINYGY